MEPLCLRPAESPQHQLSKCGAVMPDTQGKVRCASIAQVCQMFFLCLVLCVSKGAKDLFCPSLCPACASSSAVNLCISCFCAAHRVPGGGCLGGEQAPGCKYGHRRPSTKRRSPCEGERQSIMGS